jgi:hypothetical protein|tara:strand:+ start:173 stop:325 length:153 start_codon:yes stop_codon:yes gene_type:complete
MKKNKKVKKDKKKYNAVHAYTAMLKLFRENKPTTTSGPMDPETTESGAPK